MLDITSYLGQVNNGDINPNDFVKSTKQKIEENADSKAFIRIHHDYISQNLDSLVNRKFKWAVIWIKDNMMLEGEITSCCSKMLENYIAPYTATCVQKLIDAGFCPIWKTNMDEFAMGSSTEHSVFWPSKNPHWKGRIPGWSSGWSAVAVATGQCLASLGTDTGWSIRQPASLCGIVGFKPTYGKISRFGVQSLSSSFDQVGTLTHSVADAKLLLEVMAGEDQNDLRSRQPFSSDKLGSSSQWQAVKVAIPNEIFSEALDDRVKKLFMNSIEKIKKAGVEVDFIDFPLLKHSGSLYYILMSAELTSNLARFDGVRFGLQKSGSSYAEIRSEGFWKEVKKRLMLWNYVVLHENYDKYYKPALKARTEMKSQFSDLFEKYDVIITPTTPSPAGKIGSKTSNSLQMYLEDLYTTPANLAWLPAISIPMWMVQEWNENLPVGIQLMGAEWNDEKLLDLAAKMEKL